MVHDEDLNAGMGDIKVFVVSREFKVYARNELEAKAELEAQLKELSMAVIAVKQIALAVQRATEAARAPESDNAHEESRLLALGSLSAVTKKDHGPN